MQDILLAHYDWLRAFHIISFIAWMAGLLYLPRLYVYHADTKVGSDKDETFKIMERRLLKIITTPAMALSWVFGLAMIYANSSLLSEGWVHAKLLLVFILSGIHGVFSSWRKVFERGENKREPIFYKYWNEIPTVIMMLIVILAVVEPF